MKKYIILSILLLAFSSCQKNEEIIVSFQAITNYSQGDNLSMTMDLEDAIDSGIIVPSHRQIEGGMFRFRAELSLDPNKEYYYKVYYQNESYKFKEDNPLANENFYGSWEDVGIGFKPINHSNIIEDEFRIVGNPRDEKEYYGSSELVQTTEEDILRGIERIKSDENWYSAIVKKAEENGNSIEKQLYLDMSWVIKTEGGEPRHNHRWKRNPRVGDYSFMLVVVDEEGLESLPEGIINIGKQDSLEGFINPYSYFKYGKGRRQKGVSWLVSNQSLSLNASLSPERGVYVDILKYPDNNFRIHPNNGLVGNSDSLFKKAVFEQFFHTISKNFTMSNIPITEDISSYSRKDYKENRNKYKDSTQRINTHPFITDYPGKTVRVADSREYISLINPGNNANRKESVGVITRIGFTYGKFRGKISFPPQLNQEGVWSGLTNAFWLIYQSDADWNHRRDSKGRGYVKPGLEVAEEVGRVSRTNYSEIDIEIIKTSKYWPGEKHKEKDYDPYSKDECILATTNWDLACNSPKHYFDAGINRYKYAGKEFTYHRWSEAYRALTTRTPIDNSIFSKDFYYFEIEWKPEEIIWRIGESPDNMRVVGYMSHRFTSIPNNQMLTVITQEYHYSEYWPPIIYDQSLLPFPLNDIEGRVYDIRVE